MTASTIIDQIYEDNQTMLAFLADHGEVSLETDADNKLKKVLVLAAASYFESKIQDSINEFVHLASGGNEAVVAFVKKKALSRQYHTFFKWDGKNANSFFGLFGNAFSSEAKADVANNENLDTAVKAFLELGGIRNQLVHLNFASFPLEKTSAEIYELFQTALGFVEYVEGKLQAVGAAAAV